MAGCQRRQQLAQAFLPQTARVTHHRWSVITNILPWTYFLINIGCVLSLGWFLLVYSVGWVTGGVSRV